MELWKDIDEFPGYMVSNLGRVRGKFGGRILKPGTNRGEYLQVVLRSNGKSKTREIHRLVASAFLQNPEHKSDVDHVDGIRTNNFVSNLRWATHAENMRNKKSRPGGSSSYKGVCFAKQANKWKAKIKINGKDKYLGLFSDEASAARSYDAAALEHFRDYARLNF